MKIKDCAVDFLVYRFLNSSPSRMFSRGRGLAYNVRIMVIVHFPNARKVGSANLIILLFYRKKKFGYDSYLVSYFISKYVFFYL